MATTSSATSKAPEGAAAALIGELGRPLDAAAPPAVGAVAVPAIAAATAAAGASTLIAALGEPLDGDAKVASAKFLSLDTAHRGRQRGKRLGKDAPLLAGFEKSGHAAAIAKLALTPKEEELIRSLFKKWALDDQICLIDLMGLDLFDEIDQTLGDSPVKEKLKSDFAELFITSYTAGALTPSMQASFPTLPLSSKFFWPAAKWCEKFEQFKARLALAYLARQRKGGVNAEALQLREKMQQEVLAKLDLMIKFWKQPSHTTFLIDSSLVEFNGSALLNKGNPKLTLLHLIRLVDLLICAIKAAVAAKTFVLMGPERYEKLKAALESFRQDPSPKTLQVMRSLFLEGFGNDYVRMLSYNKMGEQAMRGELTHAQFCKVNGIKKVANPTQAEFCSQMAQNTSQAHFLRSYTDDLFRIFELRVAHLLLPGIPPLQTLFIRANWLIRLEQQHYEQRKAPQPLPSNDFAALISSKLQQMIVDSSASAFVALVNSPEFTRLVVSLQRDEASSLFKYTEWVPLLLGCKPLIAKFNKEIERLDAVRKKAVDMIIAQLTPLPMAKLKESGPELIRALRAGCFKLMREICSQTIIFKDIENFLSCQIPESADDYLYLMPPQLANLIQLEGLEERLEALIAEKQKAEDALKPAPAAAAPAVAEPVVAAAAAPSKTEPVPVQPQAAAPQKAALKLSPADKFRLRSGMNIRTVLKMLKDEGFLPIGQTGSHVKFKKKGGGEVIVPLHKDLKAGTLKGIESQVEAAQPNPSDDTA